MFDESMRARIERTVAGIDAWLETMRGANGYGGPVAHWWQSSLMYTGAGLDWRYEGVIAGYLQLWKNTNDEQWLTKACRAGDDLIEGQLKNGNFAYSGFEANPATTGTPHEAACDVGLLSLALALQQAGRSNWERYAACAELNLRMFCIDQLWDAQAQAFGDDPYVPSFVPNKAATICDALFLIAEITRNDEWVECYALPTLDRILDYQVSRDGRLDGAIAQNSLGTRKIEKYFPIYISRCVSALIRGYRWTNDERYSKCALRAMRFVTRWGYADGSFPTVVYANERVNRYPSWIAPLGDVLRAVDELRPYGFDVDMSATLERLLGGQDSSGGIQTAFGFAAQAGGHLGSMPDVRDVLHVVGWCDKAFRYLASQVEASLPISSSSTFETMCTFRGDMMRLIETPEALTISNRQNIYYRWRKGESYPEIAYEKFWLR